MVIWSHCGRRSLCRHQFCFLLLRRPRCFRPTNSPSLVSCDSSSSHTYMYFNHALAALASWFFAFPLPSSYRASQSSAMIYAGRTLARFLRQTKNRWSGILRPQVNNAPEKPRLLHLDAGTAGPVRRQVLGSRGAFTLGAVSAALVCAYGVNDESSTRLNSLTASPSIVSQPQKYGSREDMHQVIRLSSSLLCTIILLWIQ